MIDRVRPLVVLLALAAPAAGGASAQEAGRGEPDDRVEPRSFSILETSLAKQRWQEAEEHLARGRWREAFQKLQELIERHRGELLGARGRDARGRGSQMPVHPGAAESAARRLWELPANVQALYRERHGADALAAFEEARRSADRQALVEVGRRWPITRGAERAWWTLGDLELELGNARGAADAWGRAARVAALLGEAQSPSAERRQRLARELLEGAGDLAGVRPLDGPGGSLAAAGPEDPPLEVPPADCHAWRTSIDVDGESPFNGTSGSPDFYNLHPVIAGDTVLVSTSLRLLAVDAYSGELRWAGAEPPGWEELRRRGSVDDLQPRDFMEGIDRRALIVAPAAGGGVALAALQIPVTHTRNKDFQQITITTVIPDRRLFAYDLQSGEPLWNHLPPLGWNGESGSFPERMRVAGPPVIRGSRVLVPCYRLRGRVDYHVACYDLWTGELLWSQNLISGQRELNMFGRHEWEFAAPPLRVEGDVVVALTQLGALAALDLYTGDVLWETLYDQIPLPPTRQFEADKRRQFWRNAPPAVADGVVVATPVDSWDMLGVELASGRMLWSLRYSEVQRGRLREELSLIGADATTVYLSGQSLVTCRQPAGLSADRPPVEVRVSGPLGEPGEARFGAWPRPALSERHVVVPTRSRRVVIDRSDPLSIDPQLSTEWDDAGGNALLAGGALFTLTGRHLHGFFDWGELERRFARQLAQSPGDPDVAADYAALLYHRAVDRRGSGRLNEALGFLERARGVLEPLVELFDEGLPSPALTARLHEVLRLEAAVLADRIDPAAALERLERAQRLAPDRLALRDTLLDRFELLFPRDPDAALAILDELEAQCADLPQPRAGDVGLDTVPVGLWALRKRAETHALARRRAEEFAALHAILERHGDAPLEHGGGATASSRIRELIERGGAADYAEFERRADELYRRALESRDLRQLELVSELYPHSDASRRANDARIELATEHGDVTTLAEVVLAEIPADWRPERASERDVRLLLTLGGALAEAGNGAYLDGLVRSLARHRPDAVSPLADHAGRTLGDLARALPEPGSEPPALPEARFDASLRTAPFAFGGHHRYVGALRADGDGGPLLVFAREDALVALSAAEPKRARWVAPMDGSPWRRRTVLVPDRVVHENGDELIALDAASGEPAWSWRPPEGEIDELERAGGLLLVGVEVGRRHQLVALDTAAGVPVWRYALPDGTWTRPIVGDDRLVVLPGSLGHSRARVLDLFTGVETGEIDLGEHVRAPNHLWAWIDRDLLVLPYFKAYRGPLYLAGFELDGGRRAWRVDKNDARELDSIVRHGESTYLVLLADREGRPGELLELRTRLGSVRPVADVRLVREDVPVGVMKFEVTELDQPYLFLLSKDEASGPRIRAVHLPYGERWVHRLQTQELYNEIMPLPALSEDTVALVYAETSSDRSSRTRMILLDRASGAKRDDRILDPDLGRARELTLIGLDGALLLVGGRRVDVLEVPR